MRCWGSRERFGEWEVWGWLMRSVGDGAEGEEGGGGRREFSGCGGGANLA